MATKHEIINEVLFKLFYKEDSFGATRNVPLDLYFVVHPVHEPNDTQIGIFVCVQDWSSFHGTVEADVTDSKGELVDHDLIDAPRRNEYLIHDRKSHVSHDYVVGHF